MRRILVVDDDPGTRMLLGEVLEAMDYQMEMAADGAEALDSVRRSAPDAVILDLGMPGMGGREFLAACREDPACRDLPVLLLTAADQEATDVARTYGAHLVVKPFDVVPLLAELQALERQNS